MSSSACNQRPARDSRERATTGFLPAWLGHRPGQHWRFPGVSVNGGGAFGAADSRRDPHAVVGLRSLAVAVASRVIIGGVRVWFAGSRPSSASSVIMVQYGGPCSGAAFIRSVVGRHHLLYGHLPAGRPQTRSPGFPPNGDDSPHFVGSRPGGRRALTRPPLLSVPRAGCPRALPARLSLTFFQPTKVWLAASA